MGGRTDTISTAPPFSCAEAPAEYRQQCLAQLKCLEADPSLNAGACQQKCTCGGTCDSAEEQAAFSACTNKCQAISQKLQACTNALLQTSKSTAPPFSCAEAPAEYR